ncbi:endonuclease/exonuclease/phosphatase family protein [Streptomyces sp. MBT42]|uniref:endonuclease/exonuclease/phosphatase family protein n=1 Tax=unclassified Streptomyces TaxID=2593676 RepID=UPI001E3EB565|nr:endonuclease/exonuclease/phosphatase family protein [Streptomyces sp. MBT42]MCD2469539.1 endonuclease/exonuclease/phosphatase family protein [Streptomyces sp. MBT42]
MRRRKAFAILLALLFALGVMQPAVADEPSPSTAPVVRFLSYNICGNSKETRDCSATREVAKRQKRVVGEALAWKADLVFLQEVCRQQYDAIAGNLSPHGYNGSFVTTLTKRADLCTMAGGDGDYGIAVFAKGPITGEVTIDPDTPETRKYTAPENWYAACVEAAIQSVKTRACSVHLWPNHEENPTTGIKYPLDLTKKQAQKLASDPWLNDGKPVVLGGDFNPVNRNAGGSRANRPRSVELDPFYRPALGGTGRFIEADETDSDYFDQPCKAVSPLPSSCRSGEPTHTAWSSTTPAKLDYIFVNEARFKNVAGNAELRDSEVSDHHPYRGAATFSHCNNPGDGKADMLRRDASGDLWRHFGRSDGKIAADPCKVGAGWTGMRHVARAGDVDKDGDEDLYAIDSSGSLLFYPGDATELFFRAPRTISSGWGAVDLLIASPDMNGDSNPDLIARRNDGTLWRTPTRPDGGVGPEVEIINPTGWSPATYDTILAPGNVGGDSSPDLLARTPGGGMFLYTGNTAGTLNPPVQIGHGWDIYNTVLAPGNFDGDSNGRPDLLARKPNGDIFFYAGTGDATTPFINPPWPHQDVDRSGWGFAPGDLLF